MEEEYFDGADLLGVENSLSRRLPGAKAGDLPEGDVVNGPLERQKFRLMQTFSRDKKACAELDERIAAAQLILEERKQHLSDSNALFMTMPDASTKAPRQRLGANNAVLGIKRIIERELTKVRKETSVMAMKVNKAKAKNASLRSSIDACRKDAMTFRKLFRSMSEELTALQANIRDAKNEIDDGYAERDHALEDMRSLTKQFDVDKLERQQEWQVFSDAIEKANNEGVPEHMEAASGLLTQAEGDELRKKIKRGHAKMQKDRYLLQSAQSKLAMFKTAIQTVRDATGYDDLQDVIDLFERYEEEKFTKVGVATRLVSEIERLEKEVASARSSASVADASRSSVKESRAALLASLTAQARSAEAAAGAEGAAAAGAIGELKSLARVIEFAFRAVGADAAVDPGMHAMEHEELAQRAAAAAAAVTAATGTGGEGKPLVALPGGRPFAPGALWDATASPGAGAPSPAGPVLQLLSLQGATTGHQSPLRSRAGSLSMYTSSASTAQEVAAGVAVGSLPRFVGLLETRAADIVNLYVAHKMQQSEVATAAAARAQSEAAALAAALSSPGGSLVQPPPGGATTELVPAEGSAGGPGSHLDAEAARCLSEATAAAAAIGPPKPTGLLKESLAASSLVASLLDATRLSSAAGSAGTSPFNTAGWATTTSGQQQLRGGAEGDGADALSNSVAAASRLQQRGGDATTTSTGKSGLSLGGGPGPSGGDTDILRPLSIAELKRQAAASMSNDKSVKAVRTAAAIAATVLTRAS